MILVKNYISDFNIYDKVVEVVGRVLSSSRVGASLPFLSAVEFYFPYLHSS